VRPRSRATSLDEETIRLFVALQMQVSPGLSRAEADARVRVHLHLGGRAHRREGGASLRDLTRAIRSASPQAIRRALAHAQATGTIRAVAVPSGPWGGRPTTHYELAHGDKTR
jgi:hypothetical protein